MTGHPTVEELANAAEGLLPEERAAAVAQHLAECDDCRQTSLRWAMSRPPWPPNRDRPCRAPSLIG